MEKVRLIIPEPKYLQSYYEACVEYKKYGVKDFVLHDPDDFDGWKDSLFDRFEEGRRGIGLPEGYVPATTFWLVEGGEYIGMGNIRHGLTKALEHFGGHIGYGIRVSRWGQGYGTLQLKLLLKQCPALGINPALITYDKDNIGSAKVIENNGGRLQDIIENVIDGKTRMTCRYWVPTGE